MKKLKEFLKKEAVKNIFRKIKDITIDILIMNLIKEFIKQIMSLFS